MITRQEVVDKAREYLGTPFLHQGRLKGEGIDCAGLLMCVAKELDLIAEDFEFTRYDLLNDGTHLIRIISDYGVEIDREDVQPGDVCVIKMYESPQHCAFYSDIGIIHTLKKVVEHRIDEKWEKKIVHSFKLNGVQ